MQDLFSLIQCLTSREWESLQSYLTCFSTHATDEGGPKQLQLARILKEETDCPSQVRCCLKIYGLKEDPGFDMLKGRLKEKALDFLLTDISGDKQLDLAGVDLAIIKIKKKSAQFQQLYYSKERMPLLYQLLDEVIYLSKEYHQYIILIEHLRIKKMLVSWKKGGQALQKMQNEIEGVILCDSLYNKAEHYYCELMALGDFHGKYDHQKYLLSLKEQISEIKIGFEKTGSPIVHYLLKFLEMGYFLLRKNYPMARSVCVDLLNIVRNNESVYRRQRISIVYDNLSRCEFYMDNFEEAVECAREAQKHFNLNSENYCISLEQEFYAWFAMKQYPNSIGIANKMIGSATRKELGEFRFSKYNYLHANALFMQRKFEDALGILSEEREISKDKAGWETGARILTIMTLIEMLKLDEASLAVFSLKQFFKRADKKTPISKRDKTILNLLLILERAGFMFSTLNGSTQKNLVALGSKDENLRWEPFTPELIPFHEWFVGKMRGRISVTAVKPKKTLSKVKVVSR